MEICYRLPFSKSSLLKKSGILFLPGVVILNKTYKNYAAVLDFDKRLVEKYLNGTATEREAQKVLEWFETPEGQKYLSTQIDMDLNRIGEFSADSTRASQTLESIHSQIERQNILNIQKYRVRPRTSGWAVAASVAFLAVFLSYIYTFYGDDFVQEESVVTPVVYETGIDQHRIITLQDGTQIRLNENSTLTIPGVPDPELRMVYLEGEAFFDVASDSLRPFIVEASEAEVRVLGTQFNVKTSAQSGNLVVAVSEGRVSLGSKEKMPDQRQMLVKNMVGLLNFETHEITTEKIGVINYTSWMHGRVIFERTPFKQVVRQLSHIYNIRNDIEDEEIVDLRLTADFSERSLDNVLETIASSLGIKVERNDEVVIWKNPE